MPLKIMYIPYAIMSVYLICDIRVTRVGETPKHVYNTFVLQLNRIITFIVGDEIITGFAMKLALRFYSYRVCLKPDLSPEIIFFFNLIFQNYYCTEEPHLLDF